MVSSAGSIVESSTITTTELGLLNGIVSVSTGVGDNDKFVTQGYVDDNVSTQDLDFAGDSGTGAVDLNTQTFTVSGTSNQVITSAASQTITLSC